MSTYRVQTRQRGNAGGKTSLHKRFLPPFPDLDPTLKVLCGGGVMGWVLLCLRLKDLTTQSITCTNVYLKPIKHPLTSLLGNVSIKKQMCENVCCVWRKTCVFLYLECIEIGFWLGLSDGWNLIWCHLNLFDLSHVLFHTYSHLTHFTRSAHDFTLWYLFLYYSHGVIHRCFRQIWVMKYDMMMKYDEFLIDHEVSQDKTWCQIKCNTVTV